ncbi:flagellar filament capping protein FliD [Wukongibacter baidiensis]|uniref:flagellar filament capping protein FliD n=1 Tax=Wukongibacter baidiensis TaxID=1723361 RepID=UPI003D7FE510
MYISGTTSSSRMTGMVTGMDVDQMVKDLMEVEKQPLDKAYQEKQLMEWKMDAYREVIMEVKGFEDTYFNYLNPSNNMLSPSTYIIYNCTSSNENAVKVSAGPDAVEGNHSLEVLNTATAANLQSSSGISKEIEGTSPPDFTAAHGQTFQMDVDGTTKTIAIDNSINDVNDMQTAVDEAFGSNKIEVALTTSGTLTFKPVPNSGVHNITLSSTPDNDALNSLGFGSGSTLSNRIDTSDSLEDVASSMKTPFNFDSNGQVVLTINDETFEFDKDTTLDQMMNEINTNPNAGVHMMYDEISDKFIFTATQTGAGNNIQITESGSSFMSSAGINDYTAGEDAVVILDGERLTRSDNTFTVAGVTYTVLTETTEPVNMSVSLNTDAIYENIVSFVDAYNQLIDSLYGEISEPYDREYPPLTPEQKAEMSEEEIRLWEEKAQTGLLSNDPIIEDMLRDMREALYEPVEGVSITLPEIGITTGSYDQHGKLVVDEEKLKQSIEENPQAVMSLFCQESSSYPGTDVRPLDGEERQVRYEEEGIAYRMYDIMEDNVSIYRNENGQKGALLEKVGMVGDSSEYDNFYYSQIEDYEEEIAELEKKMIEKENDYYDQFAAMEVAIQQMNAQLESIMSMFE